MFEIGNSLREARIRQGLDYPEIEQATKIRVRYLRALEDEEFGVLPASTYVKGFLRTYADYLGLDGGLYVDEYNSRYVIGEEEPPLRRASVAGTRQHRRVESRVVLIALAAIAIVTALVIAAFKSTGSGSPGGNAATETLQKPKKKHHATKHTVVPATLIVTATSPTYVKLRLASASGKQVFAGTLDRGQWHRWYAKRFWIAASDPAGVRLTVNGHVRRLPAAAKRVGVVVTASGLKASSGA